MTERNMSPEQMEHEIGATRREIDRTLDALQRKLSPGQILDQALGYAKEGGGEFAGNLGRTLRDNPVPIMLTGVGLAWLMLAGQGTGGRGDGALRGAEAAGAEGMHRARAATETVRAHAADYAHRTREHTSRAVQETGRAIHDHPLVFGALAAALGSAIAAVVSPTRREDELFGQYSAGLKRDIRDATDEGIEKAVEVGHEAVAAAKQEARRQGLGSEGAEREAGGSAQAGAKVMWGASPRSDPAH